MKVTLVGTISQIGKVETFGENGFEKRELILKTVEEYPNYYVIEFTKDRMQILDNWKEGDNVKIKANLRGREHTNDAGKYNVFMSLNGWEIEAI